MGEEEGGAVDLRRGLLSHAAGGANGTGPPRGKPALARAALRAENRAGSRPNSGERVSPGRRRRKETVNFRQILTAPNQLTLLRMIFLPFIVINLLKHDFKWALALFVLAGMSDGLDGLLAL